MLTPQQKAEAALKLKNMNEEAAKEEQLRATIRKTAKNIRDTISSMKQDPKRQLELIKRLANQQLPSKISLFERINVALTDTQEKMKAEKDKLGKETLSLYEEKDRFEGGIDEIKKTIANIKKTVAQSVQEQTRKRAQIQQNLEKSLKEIREKIIQFQAETEVFNKDNAELQVKIDELKAKLGGIEDTYKGKADEKDEEVKAEKEELTQKLKELEAEVEAATQMSKEYTALEKKNFDNKISLYMRTKKFPELSSGFQSSASTLNDCKGELQKGVQRMNNASETISKCKAEAEEINNQYLIELKRQKEKESKIDELKREKELVRAQIIELQRRVKEKNAAA